jgi:hypothetical protein
MYDDINTNYDKLIKQRDLELIKSDENEKTKKSENLNTYPKLKRTMEIFNDHDLEDLAQIGGKHFEGGIINFPDWSNKMIEEVGEKVIPYLSGVYIGINNYFNKIAENKIPLQPNKSDNSKDELLDKKENEGKHKNLQDKLFEAKIMKTKNFFKLLLAIALLACLLLMPFWYYQLIRILGMVGFLYFAYLDYKDNIKFTPQFFVISAIIINPFFKIPFDKKDWQYIDVIFSAFILLTVLIETIRIRSFFIKIKSIWDKTNKIKLIKLVILLLLIVFILLLFINN